MPSQVQCSQDAWTDGVWRTWRGAHHLLLLKAVGRRPILLVSSGLLCLWHGVMHQCIVLQVWEADLYNVPVALKLPITRGSADGSLDSSASSAAADFMHEAAAMEVCSPLQGICIPRLIGHGTIITVVSRL
jgi:hypothetical protein